MNLALKRLPHPLQLLCLLCMLCLFIALPLHAAAGPYPLGTLTCKDMGAIASRAMEWRERGMTLEAAMIKLAEREFAESIERTNAEAVLRLVFGRYGNAWTVESAGNAIRSDCETGR